MLMTVDVDMLSSLYMLGECKPGIMFIIQLNIHVDTLYRLECV
jgi:hypothetical protein